MKIIKHGNYSTIERYKCNNCECVFELDTYTDDTRTYGTHDTYDRWEPVCPECGASFCIEKIEVKDEVHN